MTKEFYWLLGAFFVLVLFTLILLLGRQSTPTPPSVQIEATSPIPTATSIPSNTPQVDYTSERNSCLNSANSYGQTCINQCNNQAYSAAALCPSSSDSQECYYNASSYGRSCMQDCVDNLVKLTDQCHTKYGN